MQSRTNPLQAPSDPVGFMTPNVPPFQHPLAGTPQKQQQLQYGKDISGLYGKKLWLQTMGLRLDLKYSLQEGSSCLLSIGNEEW